MATISDLRTHLFNALEALASKSDPMAIDRAKAVADVAQVVINSAKVEVEYLRATGGKLGTGFITDHEAPVANGITSVTKHVLK